MDSVMLWLSFIGAWLLFAGPIYQAALELRDEDIEIDRIRAAGAQVQKPAKPSMWWWVVPPLKLYMELKMRREYQRRYIAALSHEDLEAIVSYRSKASAWSLVAFGGFLIATNETYVLVHHYHWSDILLAAIVVLLFLLSILNLIMRVRRAEALINPK